jgi:hypothetical protein
LSSVSAKVRGPSAAVNGRKHPVIVEDRIIPAVATKYLVFIVIGLKFFKDQMYQW